MGQSSLATLSLESQKCWELRAVTLPGDEATFLLEMPWLSGEKLLFAHTPSPDTPLKKKKAAGAQSPGSQRV